MPNRPDRARMTELRTLAKRYVKVYGRVNTAMSRSITPPMLDTAATQLGLMDDGQLFASGDNELAMILDVATFEVRTDGTTAVERYLAAHPPAAGSAEARLPHAMRAARFSVYLIDGVEEGIGIQVHDQLGGAPRLLFGPNLDSPAVLGLWFAARLITIDDVSFLSGVLLPLDEFGSEDILEELVEFFPDRAVDDLHGLPPEDQSVVTTVIAINGLEATDWMKEQLAIQDSELEAEPEIESPELPSSFPPPPARPAAVFNQETANATATVADSYEPPSVLDG